jgi:hypothetical protein
VRGRKYLYSTIDLLLLISIWILLSRSILVPSGIPPSIKALANEIRKGLFTSTDSINHGKVLSSESIVYNRIRALLSSEKGGTYNFNNRKKVIILIVLESLGRKADSPLSEISFKTIENAFKKIIVGTNYEIIYVGADVPIGSTLGAELQYLCNIKSLQQISDWRMKNSGRKLNLCIPNIAKNRKYNTYYIHDGDSEMYQRSSLFPKLGFDQLYFQDRTDSKRYWANCISRPFCGSDENAYKKLLSLLDNIQRSKYSNNSYISMMTIDTHAPYYGGSSIEKAYIEKLHRWLPIFQRFIRQILTNYPDLAISLVLTSDHPPPINNNLGGNNLSKRNRAKDPLDLNDIYMITMKVTAHN